MFGGLLLAAVALRWALGRLWLTGPYPARAAAADAVLFGLLMGGVASAYTWLKLLIPAINVRLWDVQLGALDRFLCRGVDPNRFALGILEGNPRWVGFAFDGVYCLWGEAALIGCLILLTSADARLRRGAAVSLALLWLAGTWIYVALPALGPALVDLEVWTQVRTVLPNSAGAERSLLANYVGIRTILAGSPMSINPSYGVAAMPSLHVGVDLLLALWARWQARWWAWVWWILAGLTAVGAMATGWHYLTDVLAGAGLAVVVYLAWRTR